MKKILLVALGLAAACLSAQATLILDEPFSYADGALTTLATNWTTFSGTAGQVDVAGGKVNVTQTESEDVTRLIPGNPFTTGFLYGSFVVNFSLLPGGSGTYFALLKDSGTSNFRCKVFATTTNAGTAVGSFRVGVANGGANTPAVVPKDLALGTSYTLVIRYNCATAASTLWINPNTETSTSDRADGVDTTGTLSIYGFALRQSLSSGTGMGTLTVDDLKIATTFCEVVTCGSAVSNPPSISAIASQSIPMNSVTPAIPFTVSDGETAASNLVVSAVSSNPTLVPNNPANLTLTGTDGSRTITVTPAAGLQGVTTITITVLDTDGNTTPRSFFVTVGAPTISAVGNQITPMNTASAAIPFTVGDAETAAGSLTLTMYSLNPTLVPAANVSFGGTGSNRTAVITPAAGQAGVAVVGFIVSDGTSTASNQFTLTVAKSLGIDLNETFTYADGPIVPNSGYVWDRYSGGTNEALVAGGKLLLAQTNSEDIKAFIGYGDPNGYYIMAGGYVVYYSFQVNCLQLPLGASGDYFAFLKDGGTLNFRGRVFATTNGAAPGSYRIGVANGFSSPSGVVASDLALGTPYTVMVRYNVGTAETKLWVNPASEASSGVDATDATTPVDIWNFAFRQNTNAGTAMGILTVDNLKLATAWSDAYQAPNWPPTITDIADLTTPYGTPTAAIPFTIGDPETAAGSLLVSVTSSNPAVVPTSNIALGGSGAARTITITPVTGQSGPSLITVTVTDAGGLTASDSFLLMVLGGNNPPQISTIASQTTGIGTPSADLPFTVFDYETPAASLTVGGSSSNPALVPDGNIVFGGSGSNRTVRVTPLAGQVGTATITVSVGDGTYTTTTTFGVTVNIALLLADTFSYTDGSIVTNSGFFWTNHSGTAGQMQVSQGKLRVTSTQTEDVNAVITNAPFAPASGAILYAGFTVNFSALPGSEYFAHYKDSSSTFRGKIFATTSNAAPGSFRLGIANSVNTLGATNPPYALDLSTNTAYRVVTRYNVATATTTLWISPTRETDPSVTATDTSAAATVIAFVFRQSSGNGGMGTMTVDDLMVGTTFDTVKGQVPVVRPPLAITRAGTSVVVSWTTNASGSTLQTCTNLLPVSWNDVGATFPMDGTRFVFTNASPAGRLFYRLRP